MTSSLFPDADIEAMIEAKERAEAEIYRLRLLLEEIALDRAALAGRASAEEARQRVFVSVLAHHALVEVRCDHEARLDMPVCNCALWAGGWHPTVQAAKEAWAAHVRAALNEAAANRG